MPLKPPSLTLGVEEEYQIVDPESRALRSYITRILEQELGEDVQLRPELHQSMVEVGTKPCDTPAEVRADLVRLRGSVMGILQRDGLALASAGSHPFSTWWDQEITPLERYVGVKHDMGDLAHRLLIFGMHVHVGIEDKEFAIDALNCARYFLPHLLALTTSSPFWIGRNTGLKSYRSTVFRGFPRTGIPTRLSGWAEYQEYIDTLVAVGSIPDGSKIWWDARPHYKYPTLEFRLCDACTRVDEAVCVAAILQALVYKLWQMRLDNVTWRDYSSRLIDENKWRAMRFGLSGSLIDFGRHVEKPAPELIREFIEWFLGGVVDELGTRREVEYAYRILDEGSSADRQLAVYARTGSLEAVVDQILAETAEGVTVIPRSELRPVAATGEDRRTGTTPDPRFPGAPDRRSNPHGGPEDRIEPPIRIGDLEIGRVAPVGAPLAVTAAGAEPVAVPLVGGASLGGAPLGGAPRGGAPRGGAPAGGVTTLPSAPGVH